LVFAQPAAEPVAGDEVQLYTMRPSNLGAPPGEDFIFSYDGVDAGRCYLRGLTGGEQKWWWTIYIGLGPGTPRQEVQGAPIQGAAGTLDQAQQAFKMSFEKLIAAGVVSDPRRDKRL
jgi:hypothetical protein